MSVRSSLCLASRLSAAVLSLPTPAGWKSPCTSTHPPEPLSVSTSDAKWSHVSGGVWVRWGLGADREDAAIVQRPGGRGQRSGRAGPNVHATGFGPTGTLDHVVRRPADWLDWLFRVGLGIKGLDGLLELTGGVLLLVTSEATLAGWVTALTQHELSEDPGDLVATSLQDAVSGLSGSAGTFAAWYLLGHGVVKVVLVAAVLSNRLWAYPWMIAFLVLFIAYQAYRFALGPSIGLALLTAFDVLIVWLTYREYGRQRSRPPARDHR